LTHLLSRSLLRRNDTVGRLEVHFFMDSQVGMFQATNERAHCIALYGSPYEMREMENDSLSEKYERYPLIVGVVNHWVFPWGRIVRQRTNSRVRNLKKNPFLFKLYKVNFKGCTFYPFSSAFRRLDR